MSSEDQESPAGTYARIKKLTDKLIAAEEDLEKNPGHHRALVLQRLKADRKKLQVNIKPHLVWENT